jgi:zinc transport system substrate-binding protein
MGRRIYFLLFALLGFCWSAKANAPNVVVTIKPIHSLVAGVMSGVKMPLLLMSGERSPHTQPLAPAEVRQINASQVIVWVGPSYETPLRRVIESVKACKHVITLLDKPGMKLYPMRKGGLWGSHDHSQDACEQPEHHADHEHNTFSIDGHLWLDPCNAKVIVEVIAQELSDLDPQHKAAYLANSEKVIKRLEDLDQELKVLLRPVEDKPYVAYHDGTQYFDGRFKTRGIGVLIGDGYYGVNAKHVLQILEYIQTQQVQCIFTEPQFPTDKIHSLMDGQAGTRVKTLDYLGAGLKAGEDAYFEMMRQLADAFLKGLREP